jgi:hypothetical protein
MHSGQNRTQMERIQRIYADYFQLIRVNPLYPPHPRSIFGGVTQFSLTLQRP